MQHAPIQDDTEELTALARQILRDRYNPFAWRNSAFTVHDWVHAAEQALEGDFDDLRYYSDEDERLDAGYPHESYADYADYMNDRIRDDRMVAQWEAGQ